MIETGWVAGGGTHPSQVSYFRPDRRVATKTRSQCAELKRVTDNTIDTQASLDHYYNISHRQEYKMVSFVSYSHDRIS